MPQGLKHAIIKPLLKKPGLELNLKNYRPVSNLKFLSKIIEGAVIEELNRHLDKQSLHDPQQSAYTAFHAIMQIEFLSIKFHTIGQMSSFSNIMLILTYKIKICIHLCIT